jgi:hypothetical protein
LHCGQAKVRKSWPDALGSIAVNLIGEPQAMHCGPWFCVSNMRFSPFLAEAGTQFGACSGLERQRLDAVCSVTLSVRSHLKQS